MTSKPGFCIFKNHDKKEGTKQPDYRMVQNTGEKWEPIGVCWKKYDKNGNPFFSCVYDEPKDPKVEEAKKEADVQYENM